jgi:hypothetical protein
VASIDSWQALSLHFGNNEGVKRDNIYYLTEFGSLKNKANEPVIDFNRRFNKLYNKIPRDIKPSQQAAKVTYARVLMLTLPWF